MTDNILNFDLDLWSNAENESVKGASQSANGVVPCANSGAAAVSNGGAKPSANSLAPSANSGAAASSNGDNSTENSESDDMPVWDTYDEVKAFVDELCDAQINICETYDQWFKIGFALAGCLGEEGRELFHRLSAQSSKYDFAENEKKYDNCLRTYNGSINIQTLYWYAREAGFDLVDYAVRHNLEVDYSTIEGECLQGENDDEFGTNGTNGTNGTPCNLYNNYYNSLIINDSNILDEKTRGVPNVPNVPNVPTFSDQIAEDEWCDYLRPIVQKMKDAESRDKMLLSALVLNSALMPNLYGRYGNKDIFPNLYLIISGLSGGGKGEIQLAKHIVKPYSDEAKKNFEKALADYQQKFALWKEAAKQKKDPTKIGDAPIEPQEKYIFIPADSTEAAALRELKINEGKGIIFDSEGSVVRKALKSDYKDYSSIMLKAFHHENISVARIKDEIRYDIPNPRLSILLTCTPGELPKLFPSFEDGLGTRFLFYQLAPHVEWKDQLNDDDQLDYLFYELGTQTLDFYHQLSDLKNRRIKFILTPEQQQRFNQFFQEVQLQEFETHGDGILSFVKRLGLSAFRLAMVLSLLRRHSDRKGIMHLFTDSEQTLVCSDLDFKIMLTIMETLIAHTSTMFAEISTNSGQSATNISSTNNMEVVLFNALPDEFKYDDVKRIATNLGLYDRTARKYLAKYISQYRTVERVKFGHYKKVVQNNASGDKTHVFNHQNPHV